MAALHMVQKKENQKAASSEHNSEKATLFETKIPGNLKLLPAAWSNNSEASYLVQFFSPISNILVTVFKIQRSPNALQISFFFKTFTYNFFFVYWFIFKLSQISSRITQPLLIKTSSHYKCDIFVFIFSIPANCRAKVTQKKLNI